MSRTNVVEKPSVEYLEQLLHQAVIDVEFRSDLLTNPEAFGIAGDMQFVVPESVIKQDISFVELVGDDAGIAAPIVARCRTTCWSGWTIRCDGTTG